MKNRASEFCILKGIGTAMEYASMLGISRDRALDILLCRVVLTQEEIERSCEVFECSVREFLCD